MGERSSILPDPCNRFCHVETAAQEALDRYEAQPSLTVSFSHPNGSIVYVGRQIEDRESLIHDPQPAIDQLTDSLARIPCEFTKTGQCGAAAFLVERSLNNNLGREI